MTKKLTKLERQEKLNAAKDKKGGKKAKSAKVMKAKTSKAKKPKADTAIGHNSSGVVLNKPLLEIITNIEELQANQKEIAKAIRDYVAKAKDEHSVSSAVLKHEIRMRKLDNDVRAQFEHGVKDLQDMIGYQMSLSLAAPEDEGEGEQEGAGNGGEAYHSDAGDDEQLAAGGLH